MHHKELYLFSLHGAAQEDTKHCEYLFVNRNLFELTTPVFERYEVIGTSMRAGYYVILFLYQYLQLKLTQYIMQQFSLFRLYSGFIHQIISLCVNIKTQLTRNPTTSWEARSTTSNWCRYIRLIDIILSILPRPVVRETTVEIYKINSYCNIYIADMRRKHVTKWIKRNK